MNGQDYFLMSREWKVIRMRAIERDGGECSACGRRAGNGLVMNVDHIKPRTRHPDLALNVDNLQLLCSDCNRGKGNKFETDWRRPMMPGTGTPEEEANRQRQLADIKRLMGEQEAPG